MAAKMSIRPNGPYLVEGEVELVDVNGNKIDTSGRGPRFALCRCGASVSKPFCDGTHSKIGWRRRASSKACSIVFPSAGEANEVREAFAALLGDDHLGVPRRVWANASVTSTPFHPKSPTSGRI